MKLHIGGFGHDDHAKSYKVKASWNLKEKVVECTFTFQGIKIRHCLLELSERVAIDWARSLLMISEGSNLAAPLQFSGEKIKAEISYQVKKPGQQDYARNFIITCDSLVCHVTKSGDKRDIHCQIEYKDKIPSRAHSPKTVLRHGFRLFLLADEAVAFARCLLNVAEKRVAEDTLVFNSAD